MIFLKYKDNNSDFTPLFNRTAFPEDIERSVASMLTEIRQNGDDAIIKYAAQFDSLSLTPDTLRVTQEEIDNASRKDRTSS